MSRPRPNPLAHQQLPRQGQLYAIRVAFSALVLLLLVFSDTACRTQPVAHGWLLLFGAAYPHLGHLLLGRFGGRRSKALLLADGVFAGAVIGAVGLFSSTSAVLAAISLFNWTIIGGPLMVAAGMLAALAGIALAGTQAITPAATNSCVALDALAALLLIGYFSTIGLFMFRYLGVLRLQQADMQAGTDAANYARTLANRALLGMLPPGAASTLGSKGTLVPATVNHATLLLLEFVWPHGASPAIEDLADCFQIGDRILGRHGFEGIKTFNRCYLAMSCAASGPDDAVAATRELCTFLCDHGALMDAPTARRSVRATLHCGSVNTGLIQPDRLNFDLLGPAVEALNALASKAAEQPVATLTASAAAHRQLRNSADFVAKTDAIDVSWYLLALQPEQ